VKGWQGRTRQGESGAGNNGGRKGKREREREKEGRKRSLLVGAWRKEGGKVQKGSPGKGEKGALLCACLCGCLCADLAISSSRECVNVGAVIAV
jgi:hypothetical protein